MMTNITAHRQTSFSTWVCDCMDNFPFANKKNNCFATTCQNNESMTGGSEYNLGTIFYGNQYLCANFRNSNRSHWIPIRGHRSELGTFSFRRPPHPPTWPAILSKIPPLSVPFHPVRSVPSRFPPSRHECRMIRFGFSADP